MSYYPGDPRAKAEINALALMLLVDAILWAVCRG